MTKRRRHHQPPEPEPPPVVDISAQIQAAIDEGFAPIRAALDEREQRAAGLEGIVERDYSIDLNEVLTTAGRRLGVFEAALPDFTWRASADFSLDSGNLVPRGDDGAPAFSLESPYALLELDEWAETLREEAPHLFSEIDKEKR